MATQIFYPDAHPESTTVDGWTSRSLADEVWATIIASDATSKSDSSSQLVIQIIASSTVDQWERLYRSILLFDVSTIVPAFALITEVVLGLYGDFKIDTLNASPRVNIYSSNPASNVAIALADHLSLGSIPFSDTPIAYDDWSVSGYNDFILNAAGLNALEAAINGDGILKLGIRDVDYDVAQVAPPWLNGNQSQIRMYSADKGGNFRPRLVATYPSGYSQAQIIG